MPYPWRILIEQHTGLTEHKVMHAHLHPEVFDSRDEAREFARTAADEFEPDHPIMLQGRLVLRKDEDTYIVLTKGATTMFHFSVHVCQQTSMRDTDDYDDHQQFAHCRDDGIEPWAYLQ
ncbi:hypothetical protein [Glycomyces paridis]|uniref:Uncharacterized protein n=1 Tax=Glycomyces paridis TaxID=2126555 RepID=A0A4S8PAS2_9ACTN|nr:hypothetical protein [Glycomyces paridis]THV26675.1 hypothetical protein E9998_16905 [Glycomyces paridis]